ncbi:MAG TPA: DUF2058 family protein [Gammaproteobacteria bacterium]|nr:DUF2058 family protein [Gammaproteobacteria bacterium]
MKNALQEQLLKAGLATEDQMIKPRKKPGKPASRPARKPRGKPNQPGKKRPARPSSQSDLAAAYAARQRAEKEEAEQKRRAKAKKKANRSKIRQITLEHCKNVAEAEIPFQFMVGSNIKKVYVTAEQRNQLLEGKLQITFQDGKRCLIPAETATKIHELDPGKLIINPAAVEDKHDDDYAEFKVPDDLDW